MAILYLHQEYAGQTKRLRATESEYVSTTKTNGNKYSSILIEKTKRKRTNVYDIGIIK